MRTRHLRRSRTNRRIAGVCGGLAAYFGIDPTQRRLLFALLGLLYRQPMHGYERGKQLSATISAEWEVKPGQIANTLSRLWQEDLVEYDIAEGDD